MISVEELKRAQAEVSDEELEGVAGGGGGYWWCVIGGTLDGM